MKKTMKRRAVLAAGAAALVVVAVPKAKASRQWAQMGDAHIQIGRKRYRSSGAGWVELSPDDPLPHWSKLAKKVPRKMELRMAGPRSREAAGGHLDLAVADAVDKVQALNRKAGIRTTVTVLRRADDVAPISDLPDQEQRGRDNQYPPGGLVLRRP